MNHIGKSVVDRPMLQPSEYRVGCRIAVRFVALLVCGSTSSLWGQSGMPGFGQGGMPSVRPEEKASTYQPPVFEHREPAEPVVDVKIAGNQAVTEPRIR